MVSISTQNEVLLGSAVYMLLFGVPEAEVIGKRVRKKITRAIKKQLRTYKNVINNNKRYLDEIYTSRQILDETLIVAQRNGVKCIMNDPYTFVKYLMHRYPTLTKNIGIDDDTIEEMSKESSGDTNTWIIVKYANILCNNIAEYTGEPITKESV